MLKPEFARLFNLENDDLTCIALVGIKEDKLLGWYFMNGKGHARGQLDTGDNDCQRFSNGVSVAYSHNKALYFNRNLDVVKQTKYELSSGFFKESAIVCTEKPKKLFGLYNEHFEWRGGKCGYIDTNFQEIIEAKYPYEDIPVPTDGQH